MAKREFLQLAHRFKPAKHGIGGWYASEKLDGMRLWWDGGVTRGLAKASVPWANTAKDARFKKEQISTGLWTRYGNVIHAPEWWLNELPEVPVDGELWTGRGDRQHLMSIVKDIEPGPGWVKVSFNLFDMPSFEKLFADGLIDNVNYHKEFKDIMSWLEKKIDMLILYIPKPDTHYKTTLFLIKKYFSDNKVCSVHNQIELPYATSKAQEIVSEMALDITSIGGEGVMLRHPNAYYQTERTHNLLKIKKYLDAEGTVIGYITGRETDKGSKLLGLMGALVLELDNGERLELSGFTDEERLLTDSAWAIDSPGMIVPSHISAIQFERGSRVTFKYRDLSNDGIPQEASYFRKDEIL